MDGLRTLMAKVRIGGGDKAREAAAAGQRSRDPNATEPTTTPGHNPVPSLDDPEGTTTPEERQQEGRPLPL